MFTRAIGISVPKKNCNLVFAKTVYSLNAILLKWVVGVQLFSPLISKHELNISNYCNCYKISRQRLRHRLLFFLRIFNT